MTRRALHFFALLLAFTAGLAAARVAYACSADDRPNGSTFGGRQITDGFGYRGDYGVGNSTFHRGYDLRTNNNPQVGAFFGGTVSTHQQTNSSGRLTGYGNYAIVTNGNIRAVYAHAGSLNVTNGQNVSAGQNLGNWGSCTGTCTGPHLHLEYQVMNNGQWTKVDPGIAQGLIDQGMDPQSPEFAKAAVDATAARCSVDPNALRSQTPSRPGGIANEADRMCDPNIKANVSLQVNAAIQIRNDFITTNVTPPPSVQQVANTPCMSNELQRIANQFAYAPSMYAANGLTQINALLGPVSGIVNNLFSSSFQSFMSASSLNPGMLNFQGMAQNALGSLMSRLGVGGPFASQLCGMMVDMLLKYIQCEHPITMPSLGSITGPLFNLQSCAGQALTSTLYSAAGMQSLQSINQPVQVAPGGTFTMGTARGVGTQW